MRVHWLQHAEHEELGCIGPWLKSRGFAVAGTRLYAGERLPAVRSFDWLIVMGGPMNIYQHRRYPWLVPEKQLINDAVVNNKRVLGICLGAQLVADVLGGHVTRNKYQEIGFFDVFMGEDGAKDAGGSWRMKAFHWHGDTFSIPPGAAHQYKSDACVNQSFSWGSRVLGLQFHLEVTFSDAQRWLELENLKPARYVQSNRQILRRRREFQSNNRQMRRVLERFVGAA